MAGRPSSTAAGAGPGTGPREVAEFVLAAGRSEIPAQVRARAELLIADLAAVCIAGRPAPASVIAADYAEEVHPGGAATALLDSRRLGAVGSAWANGVLGNVLDFDDGHRLTKGHPGAVVIPAALAAAQLAGADYEAFVDAVIVGYEIAIRAGVALHERDRYYHASGSWGSLGAVAAAARLLELGTEHTVAAMGLAEYHAPISPIMRCCAEPAMTKDACAWGAMLGVSSVLLARRGFTSLTAEFLLPGAGTLGGEWLTPELYVKAYPCCRWSQGAIRAALEAGGGVPLDAASLQAVRVRSFEAADGLAKVAPEDTEQAQYNLIWPVACALARGSFDQDDVLGPFDDRGVLDVMEKIEVIVEPALTAEFPARRLTAVELDFADGRSISAGPLEALGEPDDEAEWKQVITDKWHALVVPARDLRACPTGASLGDLDAAQLLGLMSREIWKESNG